MKTLQQLTNNIDTQLTDIKMNQQKMINYLNETTNITQSASTIHYFILLDNLGNKLPVIDEICTHVQTANS